MQRASRAVAGGVVVFVLVLVAAVSGLVVAVGGAQLREAAPERTTEPGVDVFADPVTVEAEVLDVDLQGGDPGWLSVDAAFETPDGVTEVVTVDLGERTADSPPPPQVGDVLEIVVERDDPVYAVRADDPVLTGGPDEVDVTGEADAEQAREAAEALVRRSGVLAVSALGLALLVGVATVVAVALAPRPARPAWAEAVPAQDAPPRLS